MAFFSNEGRDCIPKHAIHIPKSSLNKTADKGTIKNKFVLPPTNYFEGILRALPQSTFATQLFQPGQQVDFYLNYNGFIEEVRLEMNLRVNPAGGNVNLKVPYLIERYELYSTDGSIIQTWYNDQIYLEFTSQGVDEAGFERNSSGVSATYSDVGPFVPNTNLNYVLRLPMGVSDAQIKGKSVDRYLIRIYFSDLGVTAGVSTDLQCQDLALLQYSDALSGVNEQKETQLKKNQLNIFRVLNPQRIALETVQMVPSQFYDIRLTSWTGLSSYILFIIRSSPVTAANTTNFEPVESFELYSQNSQVVGTRITSANAKNVLAKKLGGEIFKGATSSSNIYILPFAIDLKAAKNGNQTGFYQGTTREYLRVYMPSTLVAGPFEVAAYSYDYAALVANKGSLTLEK